MILFNMIACWQLPTAELWMPWLRKWKNDCAGCPEGVIRSSTLLTENDDFILTK